jgi:hypothetical protein
VCEHCADHDGQFAFTCVHCDCEESEAKYRIRDQKRRRDSGVALTLCDDCDTSGVVLCADCETSRESNVPLCENCAVGPRCAKTGDLLATLEMS